MANWSEKLPSDDVLWDLEPEELAGLLLQFIRQEHSGQWDLHTACLEIDDHSYLNEKYPQQGMLRARAKIATREAWYWLEAQGFLIPAEGENGRNGFRDTSRRADAISNFQDFEVLIAANKLPKEFLHKSIRDQVWSAFVRGEYDAAVFQAMKAVEIAVRNAAGYGNDKHGVQMMRDAFHDTNGPLIDKTLEVAEREAVAHLFAGTYGYFRNPNAHREVSLETPEEAIEIVLLANHLLRIVDASVARQAEGGSS